MAVPPAPQPRGGNISNGVSYYGTTSSNFGLPQPGFNINSDGRGLLEGTAIFIFEVDPRMPRLPALVPKRGQDHPSDSRLKCYKVDASFNNNGECRVTASYIGLEKDPTDPQIEITGSTSETSIVFHPGFASWAIETPGKPAGAGGLATLPTYKSYVETDDQGNFARFKIGVSPGDLGGVEAYLTPKATVRTTYYTGSAASVQNTQNGLGRANSNPGSFPGGLLPTMNSNWLLTNCGVSEYGNVFKVTEEYMMSESNKPWNVYIYNNDGTNGGGGGMTNLLGSKTPNLWTGAKYKLPSPAQPGNPA